MPYTTGKPDAESIRQEANHLRGLLGNLHQKLRLLDGWYSRTVNIWPNEEIKRLRGQVMPSRPTNIVDHLTDALMAFDIIAHRDPVRRGKRGQQDADAIEPWMVGAFDLAARREPVNTHVQIGKNLVLYGYAVNGVMWENGGRPVEPEKEDGESDQEYRDRLKKYEYERNAWFPLRYVAPNPARVLMDPWEKQPETCVLQYKKYAGDVANLTRSKAGQGREAVLFPDRANPYELVDVLEHWSPEWHAMTGPTGLLYVEKNVWGFNPWAHAFSGRGQEPADWENADPSHLAKGFLEPVLGSLKAEAQQMTAKQAVLIEAAWMRRGTKRDAAEFAEALQRGEILEGEEEDYWVMKNPQYTADLFQIGAETAADIQEGTFSRILSGERPQGVGTAAQHAMMSTAANQALGGIRDQLNSLTTIAAGKFLRLVDVMDAKVLAGGETIGREQIQGNYYVEVEFKVVDLLLKMQQDQQHMAEYTAGLIAPEDYYEATGRENGSEIQKRLYKHWARQDPRFRQMIVDFVLQNWQAEDFEQRLTAMMEGGGEPQGSGLVQPNGLPFTPPGSPQGARQAMNNLIEPMNGVTPNMGA